MYTTYRTVMSVYLICAVTNPCVFHRLSVASWNAVWSEDAPPGCSNGPPRTPVRWEPRGAARPTRPGHGAQPQETCPLPAEPAAAERTEPGQKVSHTARIHPRSNSHLCNLALSTPCLPLVMFLCVITAIHHLHLSSVSHSCIVL